MNTMRINFAAMLFFLLGIGLMNHANAQRIDPRWYYNINAGIIVPHDDANVDDVKIVDLRLGKSINQNWSYEYEIFANRYNFTSNDDLQQQGFMVNFLAINNEPLWRPYFLMGGGLIRHQSRHESGINPVFTVGIGGSWYFFGDNIRLRAQVVSRLDLNDNDLAGQRGMGDGVFTLGLSIPLGH